MCGGRCQVNIVITCTCANHNLKLLGSIEHLGVYDITANDDSINIGNSLKKSSLLCIFLKQGQFKTSTLNYLTDTVNSNLSKRL